MSHKEIETYGLYPQYVSNAKEREIKRLFDVILNEADSFLQSKKVTFKVQK